MKIWRAFTVEGGSPMKRMTFNLTDRAEEALTVVAYAFDVNGTDAVNRALLIVRDMLEMQAKGGRVLCEDQNGSTELIRFL